MKTQRYISGFNIHTGDRSTLNHKAKRALVNYLRRGIPPRRKGYWLRVFTKWHGAGIRYNVHFVRITAPMSAEDQAGIQDIANAYLKTLRIPLNLLNREP